MCTVSIIPLADGFRLIVNRDEERDRPPARPPAWRDVPADPAARAIWPTDPLGGGTWIGASHTGLVLAVLNVNPPGTARMPGVERAQSRGTIIPSLIHAPSAEAAAGRFASMDHTRFPPVRLVAVQANRDPRGVVIWECWWDGAALAEPRTHPAPACFVSSGLGDACVQVRLPLFQAMVSTSPTPDAQDAFHAHHWPDRPELSVLMCRAGARTISRTTVEVRGESVAMDYSEVPEPVRVPVERGLPTSHR